jgi:UDPglucose--hexose-1-phosphate uridylyltransferase
LSELRKDPLLDRWVIIAAERGRRPRDFEAPEPSPSGAACPLCEGNEDKTPPEIWALRPNGSAPDSPGWQVRVVPNKFPALEVEGEVRREGLGMFDVINGIGAHEVIIEAPEHDWHMADGPPERIERVLRAYQERLNDLYCDGRLRYVVVFRNYGPQAGASLSHPHSQLIAVPINPKRTKDKLSVAGSYYQDKERCIFCDLISQELALRERIVLDSEEFVAMCPFASRFPFEVAIYPREHEHHFGLLDESRRGALAEVLYQCLRHLRPALGDPPYNYVVNTSPNPVPRPGKPNYWSTLPLDYHWHLEIMPRVTRIAGFEWGTGFYINPVAPEEAAQFLRDAIADDRQIDAQEVAG